MRKRIYCVIFILNVTLPGGMSLDALPYLTAWRVDWRCLPWISIFSCLERHAWRPRRWDQSIGWCCHSTAILVSLFLVCPPPCPRSGRAVENRASWCARKTIAFLFERCRAITRSFLKIVTPLRSWHVLSSLFLAFASVSTFRRLLGAAAIFCWWSMSQPHTAVLTRHST